MVFALEYVRLGKDGPKVSIVGIGGWQIGATGWEGYSRENSMRAFQKALEMGVNFIDTAEAYSGAEEIIGEVIKDRREEVIVCSKVWHNHLHHDDVIRAAAGSLSRLGTNYLDLFLVHWPNPDVPLRETMAAIEKLVRDGTVRHAGVSNFPERLVIEAREALSSTDLLVNQIEYNLLMRSAELDPIPYCRREGLSIMAYSPLGQGVLSGKYDVDNPPPHDSRQGRYYRDMKSVQPLIEVLRQIAQERGKTPAQISLNWLVRDQGVTIVPIPAAKNPRQAEENAGAAGWRLTTEEINRIEKRLPAPLSLAD